MDDFLSESIKKKENIESAIKVWQDFFMRE